MRIPDNTPPSVLGVILLALYERTFFDFALAIYRADCLRRFKPEISMRDVIEVKRALEP